MAELFLDELIGRIKTIVLAHQLEQEGEFSRWSWQDSGGTRNLGINEYGCADAANILYTIGDFVSAPEKRLLWIRALQGLQNPESGLFTEPTHHPIHTTAHCIAALELFDAHPEYPLTGLGQYTDRAGLYGLLEGLDWEKNPWPQSHQGAGIYAALTLTDSVEKEWTDSYFEWLWNEADPVTGFWRKNYAWMGNAPLYQHMAGSFHYLFNHEYAHRPLRYPDRMLNSCLEMYGNGMIGDSFGESVGFLEIDWIYCLTRAGRQTSGLFHERREVLRRFAVRYTDYLCSLDYRTDDGMNDLHMLFGAVCALAELQQALPGELVTKKPLKLVLDRRPFI